MSEPTEFMFEVMCQAVFEGVPNEAGSVQLRRSAVGFRMSENLDEDYYVDSDTGRATPEGVYPVLNTMLAGIAAFCRNCGDQGTASEGVLIKYAFDELQKLFLHADATLISSGPIKPNI